jgi:mRNA-degrading endonuclease RelE of RelBE toxin-antitoxin system
VNYRFRVTPSFRKALKKLPPSQKKSAVKAFSIFKQNPFDLRLGTHKIHGLSALYKKPIYAVCVEDDLRSIFYIDGNTVWSIDIGSHAVYRT